jgi:curli biogenesis system outer membrane secretion channel CsgG
MKRVFSFIILVFIFCQVLYGQQQQQQNVAVINFEALGLSQVEAAALTDRFRSELFKTGKFTVLERDKMDEILVEQGLQQSGCTSSECLVEMGKLLNVHQIFAGSVSQFGNLFSVTVRLVDIQTGKIQDSNSQDFNSGKEKLLTDGMKAVAFYFAGIKPVAASPTVEPPVTTSNDTSALKREMLNKMSARRRSK